MSTQKWLAPESIQSYFTTELNSIANAAQSALGAAVDNETDLYEWVEFELVLASLTPTGAPSCLIYVVKSLDGTNYEDLTTSSFHIRPIALSMSTSTGAKRMVSLPVPIPPLKLKFAVENRAGPSLASSGNTLKYRRFNEQQV